MPLASPSALESEFDVCIVGEGPAGLACAFDCHDAGLRTLLLEAGGEHPLPGEPDILAAEIVHPSFHDPANIVAAHALGGSSHWWGGRAVPLDPLDFESWPIRYEVLVPWWRKAAEFLGSRCINESPAPGAFSRLVKFDATRDETYCPQIAMSKRWRSRIHAAAGPIIVLNARVCDTHIEVGRVVSLSVRTAGRTYEARAQHFVFASGGLGAIKLLLLAQRNHPDLFGPELGRGYMGHLNGSIAALAPTNPADIGAFAFRPLGHGVVARRRIRPTSEAARAARVFNIAFWLDDGGAFDASHGSSVASARYLAARALRTITKLRRSGDQTPLAPHIRNISRAPFSALMGLSKAATSLASAKLTGRHNYVTTLTPMTAGAWRIVYHAEQPSHADNRVSLAGDTDSVGNPKLKIDFQPHDEEIDSIVRAHDLLDADLKAAGAGKLVLGHPREELAGRIRAMTHDGYHQLGGAAMNRVVDENLRAYGLANLYVAAGCVFPSSGHANPTLTIVALSRRLAAHITAARHLDPPGVAAGVRQA